MIYTGGCHCGNIRFEIDADSYQANHCHCSICRKTTGAAFVSWVTVKEKTFRLIQGTLVHYKSSSYAVRQFCPICGAQVAFHSDRYPDEIDITLGLLDNAADISVSQEIWTENQLACIQLKGILVSRARGSQE